MAGVCMSCRPFSLACSVNIILTVSRFPLSVAEAHWWHDELHIVCHKCPASACLSDHLFAMSCEVWALMASSGDLLACLGSNCSVRELAIFGLLLWNVADALQLQGDEPSPAYTVLLSPACILYLNCLIWCQLPCEQCARGLNLNLMVSPFLAGCRLSILESVLHMSQ